MKPAQDFMMMFVMQVDPAALVFVDRQSAKSAKRLITMSNLMSFELLWKGKKRETSWWNLSFYINIESLGIAVQKVAC